MKRDLIPDHGPAQHNSNTTFTATLTGEESSLRAAVADARPPALVQLLDLFDELTLDEVHLVVFLSVVVELHDRAETTALRVRICRRGRWRRWWGRRN